MILKHYIKTLDVEWTSSTDEFSLMVSDLVHSEFFTKKTLTSDIARVYDALGLDDPIPERAKKNYSDRLSKD